MASNMKSPNRTTIVQKRGQKVETGMVTESPFDLLFQNEILIRNNIAPTSVHRPTITPLKQEDGPRATLLTRNPSSHTFSSSSSSLHNMVHGGQLLPADHDHSIYTLDLTKLNNYLVAVNNQMQETNTKVNYCVSEEFYRKEIAERFEIGRKLDSALLDINCLREFIYYDGKDEVKYRDKTQLLLGEFENMKMVMKRIEKQQYEGLDLFRRLKTAENTIIALEKEMKIRQEREKELAEEVKTLQDEFNELKNTSYQHDKKIYDLQTSNIDHENRLGDVEHALKEEEEDEESKKEEEEMISSLSRANSMMPGSGMMSRANSSFRSPSFRSSSRMNSFAFSRNPSQFMSSSLPSVSNLGPSINEGEASSTVAQEPKKVIDGKEKSDSVPPSIVTPHVNESTTKKEEATGTKRKPGLKKAVSFKDDLTSSEPSTKSSHGGLERKASTIIEEKTGDLIEEESPKKVAKFSQLNALPQVEKKEEVKEEKESDDEVDDDATNSGSRFRTLARSSTMRGSALTSKLDSSDSTTSMNREQSAMSMVGDPAPMLSDGANSSTSSASLSRRFSKRGSSSKNLLQLVKGIVLTKLCAIDEDVNMFKDQLNAVTQAIHYHKLLLFKKVFLHCALYRERNNKQIAFTKWKYVCKTVYDAMKTKQRNNKFKLFYTNHMVRYQYRLQEEYFEYWIDQIHRIKQGERMKNWLKLKFYHWMRRIEPNITEYMNRWKIFTIASYRSSLFNDENEDPEFINHNNSYYMNLKQSMVVYNTYTPNRFSIDSLKAAALHDLKIRWSAADRKAKDEEKYQHFEHRILLRMADYYETTIKPETTNIISNFSMKLLEIEKEFNFLRKDISRLFVHFEDLTKSLTHEVDGNFTKLNTLINNVKSQFTIQISYMKETIDDAIDKLNHELKEFHDKMIKYDHLIESQANLDKSFETTLMQITHLVNEITQLEKRLLDFTTNIKQVDNRIDTVLNTSIASNAKAISKLDGSFESLSAFYTEEFEWLKTCMKGLNQSMRVWKDNYEDFLKRYEKTIECILSGEGSEDNYRLLCENTKHFYRQYEYYKLLIIQQNVYEEHQNVPSAIIPPTTHFSSINLQPGSNKPTQLSLGYANSGAADSQANESSQQHQQRPQSAAAVLSHSHGHQKHANPALSKVIFDDRDTPQQRNKGHSSHGNHANSGGNITMTSTTAPKRFNHAILVKNTNVKKAGILEELRQKFSVKFLSSQKYRISRELGESARRIALYIANRADNYVLAYYALDKVLKMKNSGTGMNTNPGATNGENGLGAGGGENNGGSGGNMKYDSKEEDELFHYMYHNIHNLSNNGTGEGDHILNNILNKAGDVPVESYNQNERERGSRGATPSSPKERHNPHQNASASSTPTHIGKKASVIGVGGARPSSASSHGNRASSPLATSSPPPASNNNAGNNDSVPTMNAANNTAANNITNNSNTPLGSMQQSVEEARRYYLSKLRDDLSKLLYSASKHTPVNKNNSEEDRIYTLDDIVQINAYNQGRVKEIRERFLNSFVKLVTIVLDGLPIIPQFSPNSAVNTNIINGVANPVFMRVNSLSNIPGLNNNITAVGPAGGKKGVKMMMHRSQSTSNISTSSYGNISNNIFSSDGISMIPERNSPSPTSPSVYGKSGTVIFNDDDEEPLAMPDVCTPIHETKASPEIATMSPAGLLSVPNINTKLDAVVLSSSTPTANTPAATASGAVTTTATTANATYSYKYAPPFIKPEEPPVEDFLNDDQSEPVPIISNISLISPISPDFSPQTMTKAEYIATTIVQQYPRDISIRPKHLESQHNTNLDVALNKSSQILMNSRKLVGKEQEKGKDNENQE